jgi:putative membrane protein
MKTLRTTFWAIVALVLVIVGLANRTPVNLRAMPESLGKLMGISPDVTLPLFVVIFLGIGAGLLIGFVWEWMRSAKFRAEARQQGRQATELRRELDRLRDTDGDGKDDVLQILDGTR